MTLSVLYKSVSINKKISNDFWGNAHQLMTLELFHLTCGSVRAIVITLLMAAPIEEKSCNKLRYASASPISLRLELLFSLMCCISLKTSLGIMALGRHIKWSGAFGVCACLGPWRPQNLKPLNFCTSE